MSAVPSPTPATPASAPQPPPAPAPAPGPPPPIVTFTAQGVSPSELTIASGTRVTFTNNDSQPHDVQGGPDPAHPDCRELDAVGFLTPGQSRQSAPLTTVRTCDYHDHSFHSPLFSGRIVIR